MNEPKITDWIQALSAAIAGCFGVFLIFQNNRNLKELRRQNEIATEPILMMDLKQSQPETLEASNEQTDAPKKRDVLVLPNCETVIKEWEGHCTAVKLFKSPLDQIIELELFNDGKSTITSIFLSVTVFLQHHQTAQEHFRKEPFTASDSGPIELELRPGQTKTISVIRVNPVATLNCKLIVNSFKDSRSRVHDVNGLNDEISISVIDSLPESYKGLVNQLEQRPEKLIRS